VTYRFAWWRRPLYWNALHAGVVVLVIGIIWPSLINLLAFGSLTRPADEPMPALPPSSRTSPLAAAIAHTPTAELDAAVAQYTDGLAASLTPATPDLACSPGAAAVPAQAAAALSSVPLAPAAAADTGEHKSFGADKEDYYPTELKASHEHTSAGSPNR
jgi:hypothetical protein